MPSDRKIIIDQEVTGLHPLDGGRVVHIDMIELQGQQRTGNRFSSYVRPVSGIVVPEVEIPYLDAQAMASAPIFDDLVDDVMALLGDAEILMYDAAFELPFLDWEIQAANPDYASLRVTNRVTDLLSAVRFVAPDLTHARVEDRVHAWAEGMGETIREPGSGPLYAAERDFILYRKLLQRAGRAS